MSRKTLPPPTGSDLVIQPRVAMRRFEFCCSPVHRDVVTMPFGFGRDKQSGCAVPTMVLSETRGLWLFLVVRGGIQFLERLGVQAPIAPNGITDTHPRTRASQEPKGHAGDESRNGRVLTDAQAACCFRCWASKRTPFFQTSKVIAAILRARVRRAIDGFIPLATKAA